MVGSWRYQPLILRTCFSYSAGNRPNRHCDRQKSICHCSKVGPHLLPKLIASADGYLRVFDWRNPTSPFATRMVHPRGITAASFQAVSGLMSTTSHTIPHSQPNSHLLPWAIHRSTSILEEVSTEIYKLDNVFPSGPEHQAQAKRAFPFTVIHGLRPFLGVGFGTQSCLRGVGIGKGDDSESGSYAFLKKQRELAGQAPP
jgi:regulator-associated protein of mTOR